MNNKRLTCKLPKMTKWLVWVLSKDHGLRLEQAITAPPVCVLMSHWICQCKQCSICTVLCTVVQFAVQCHKHGATGDWIILMASICTLHPLPGSCTGAVHLPGVAQHTSACPSAESYVFLSLPACSLSPRTLAVLHMACLSAKSVMKAHGTGCHVHNCSLLSSSQRPTSLVQIHIKYQV